MLNFFNEESIKSVARNLRIAPRGFKYCYIPNIFKEDVYNEMIRTFPDVNKFKLVDKMSGGGRKRFYVGPDYYSGATRGCLCHMESLPDIWKRAIHESASSELIDLFQEVSGISFNSLCNFGLTYGNKGCVQEPHLDGAIRPGEKKKGDTLSTIACLLYFNEKQGGSSGTCVYDIDRKTILFQVPDLRNSLFFFEQHPDSWHGFPPVPAGEDRKLVSLSYSQEAKPIALKTSLLHKAACTLRYKHYLKGILRR